MGRPSGQTRASTTFLEQLFWATFLEHFLLNYNNLNTTLLLDVLYLSNFKHNNTNDYIGKITFIDNAFDINISTSIFKSRRARFLGDSIGFKIPLE